jgi:uncharacterized membrane protein YqjE
MTPETTAPGSLGIFGSVRQLFETVLAIVQNRLELVSVEFSEEKTRVASVLVWAGLLLFLSFMAMIAITFLVVVAFWDNAIWVLSGFSCFYLGMVGVAWLMMKKKLKAPPFPETINQLKKDREWILSRK